MYFYLNFLAIFASFFRLFSPLQLSNSTGRPSLVVPTVNSRIFIPCFQRRCFEDLGCFDAFFIGAYLSTPPLSVCPQDPDQLGVRFLVLSRGKYDEFESVDQIKPNSTVSFMIHGILSEYDQYAHLLPTYLMLKNDSDHVVAVDWSVSANPTVLSRLPLPGVSFFLTHANVEVVARMTCNLIQELVVHRNIDINSVRILGFSAGGNMIAFTGEYCKKRFNLVPGHCVGMFCLIVRAI